MFVFGIYNCWLCIITIWPDKDILVTFDFDIVLSCNLKSQYNLTHLNLP